VLLQRDPVVAAEALGAQGLGAGRLATDDEELVGLVGLVTELGFPYSMSPSSCARLVQMVRMRSQAISRWARDIRTRAF
jgi:hypothetical protein